MTKKIFFQILLPYNLQLHEQSVEVRYEEEIIELTFLRFPSRGIKAGAIPRSKVTIKMDEDHPKSEKTAWLILNRFIFAYKLVVGDYFNGDVIRELTFDKFRLHIDSGIEENGKLKPVSTKSHVREIKIGQLDNANISKIKNKLFKLLCDEKTPIDLFETLKVSVKTFYYENDYRMCVLECATALDVYLAHYLRPKLHMKEFTEEEIGKKLKLNIQKRLLEVFKEATGFEFNELNKELYKEITNDRDPKGFYNLRNDIIHKGTDAEKSEAKKALETIKKFENFIERGSFTRRIN